MAVNLNGFGYAESVTLSAATKTLTSLTDSGVVYNATVSTVITLPATVLGNTFIVRVGAPGITVAISPAAADNIAGLTSAATDNKDILATNLPAGSYVVLVADGANGYFVQRSLGPWTREA